MLSVSSAIAKVKSDDSFKTEAKEAITKHNSLTPKEICLAAGLVVITGGLALIPFIAMAVFDCIYQEDERDANNALEVYKSIKNDLHTKLKELRLSNTLNETEIIDIPVFSNGVAKLFRIQQNFRVSDNPVTLCGFVNSDNEWINSHTYEGGFTGLDRQLDNDENSALSVNNRPSRELVGGDVGIVLAVKSLKNDDSDRIARAVNTMELYSSLSSVEAAEVVFKNAAHGNGNTPVCVLIKADDPNPKKENKNGCDPHIFSAPANALASPVFDLKDRTNSLADYVVDAARKCDTNRVVLCSFEKGYSDDVVNNADPMTIISLALDSDLMKRSEGDSPADEIAKFSHTYSSMDGDKTELRQFAIDTLKSRYVSANSETLTQWIARKIVAKSYAEMILKLRADRKTVFCSDTKLPYDESRFSHFSFWTAVHKYLAESQGIKPNDTDVKEKFRALAVRPVDINNPDIVGANWVKYEEGNNAKKNRNTVLIFNVFHQNGKLGVKVEGDQIVYKTFNERLGEEVPMLPRFHEFCSQHPFSENNRPSDEWTTDDDQGSQEFLIETSSIRRLRTGQS